MKTKMQLLIGLALFAPVLLIAQTNGVPVVPAVEPSTPWWLNLLAASATIIAAVIAWLGKLAAGRMKLNAAQADMMDALTAGVAKTYDDYVRAWKAANGGRLTPDQKKLAKDQAVANAISIAKGPAKDLLLSYGKEHLSGWIEAIVTKAKGGTNDQLKAGK